MRFLLLIFVSSIMSLHAMDNQANMLERFENLKKQQSTFETLLNDMKSSLQETNKIVGLLQTEMKDLKNKQQEMSKKFDVMEENLRKHSHYYTGFYCPHGINKIFSTNEATIK